MKVKVLRSRPMIIGDKTVNPGKSITIDDARLSEIQPLLDEGLVKVEGVRFTEETGETTLREELSNLPMSELREIGYKYGCKDTSKSELVEEILKAKEG